MPNISELKKHFLLQIAAKNCKVQDPENCPNKPCHCAIAAEWQAFVCNTIPQGFRKYTIKDFHGKLSESARLSLPVALHAKKQVFEYCWGDLSLLERLPLLTDEELRKHSKIAERLKLGHNVVIHGSSPKRVQRSADAKTNSITELPLGRTFIASLIMHEALKLKLDPQYRFLQYEWVSFSDLLQCIKDDDDRAVHYEACDWLVVDDITSTLLGASPASKAFIEPLLDSFFSRRIRQHLPTILVFKFDIKPRRTEIESALGVAIGKILNSKNTTVINLSDDEAKE